MKIIFLDIDGVLNSDSFLEDNKEEPIDRDNVKVLKYIIHQTGASIVMSSGWKLWFDENMMPNGGYSQCLYDILEEFNLEIIDKTPDFTTEEIRAERTFSKVKAKEILAWLSEHNEVEKYVVIDDLDLKNDEVNSNLVKTDAQIGITKEDAEKIIKMLNGVS